MVLITSSAIGQSDEAMIRSQIIKFSEYLVNGERDKVVACYTRDAKIMPNNTDILEGKQLAQYWNPTTPGKWQTTYHKILPEEIKVWGDEAYDYGYYEGISSNGEEESKWRGKYVIIWRKVNGEWKIYLDIWNRVED